MSRTYRRCTDKKGNRKPNINLERGRNHWIHMFGPEYSEQRADDKYFNFYDKYYYTSDRSFAARTKYLKHFENRWRRAAEHTAIKKMLTDLDYADEVIFLSQYANPWDWE